MFSDPHKTDKYIVWAERTICVTPSCTYSYRWVLKGVGFVGALSFCTPFRVAFIYDEDLHINTILAPFIAVFYMCCRPHVHSPLHTVQQHHAYYSSASTKIAKLIWCNCEWKWIRGLQNKVAIMNAQKICTYVRRQNDKWVLTRRGNVKLQQWSDVTLWLVRLECYRAPNWSPAI